MFLHFLGRPFFVLYTLYSPVSVKPDGSKAKRRGSAAKRSGIYETVELKEWRVTGQDDIIAVPEEKFDVLIQSEPA
jgi:hypothetical protein